MDANGSNQTRLTNNSAVDYWPSWSPDWTKIKDSVLKLQRWQLGNLCNGRKWEQSDTTYG